LEDLIEAIELKKMLSARTELGLWIKRQIDNNKLIENKDFFLNSNENKYFFTIETAEKIIRNATRNKQAKRIQDLLQEGNKLKKVLEKIKNEQKYEIKIIKLEDEEYPEQLKKIKKPPKKLYVKGDINKLKEYGISVIGTRHCTLYGRRVCKIFTNNLVGYNLNIISGLAQGIDTCAHKSCLEAKGTTIAVLPSGFNKVFPKQNESLLNRILEKGGTIVTEYPEDFEKSPESCRERNRIIAGLSIGTLVIEAGKNSGTSITVRNTNEQEKKAFCIPSSLVSSKGIGTNRMIKNGDAKLVTEVEDIIKEFPKLKLKKKIDFNFMKTEYSQYRRNKEKNAISNLEIEEESLEIYNCLIETPQNIEEIARKLNKPINEILYKLTLLELQGAIEELPGKKFKVKKGKI